MAKTIELNEQELRAVINSAVRKVLKEENEMTKNSRGETLELCESFEDGLYDLENMYHLLKGFIGEYNTFVKSLVANATKLGLKLKDFSTERYFYLDDALDGHTYDFDFDFVVPNVDVNAMSDEEYTEFEKKLNYIYDDLEYAIGKPSFGTLKMYTTEDGISVYYTFRMRNKED